jgi:hypothetical protein
VAANLNNQARLLNQEWTMAVALSALCPDSLNESIIIRAQYLLKVGMRVPLPGHAKNVSRK